ncbi:c56e730d-d32f-4708-8235-5a50e0e4d3b5 [Thermothielavioides terrestris]|uniref:C56e730d-d32f-4708-8235-5a50e0e4d3b5 n=1 Tax=Thermothielavioides terrestris TaxID=2587410 RepID=A0A3S4EVX1_9PEZI|nr:c56e730d-d32f-4708-8235-5a50e0e4d3b5 [Thermothielavioides terrestris]
METGAVMEHCNVLDSAAQAGIVVGAAIGAVLAALTAFA